jgi:hypothetical protein
MEAIRSQNERLTDDGVLYDATALFQKIFATHGQTESTLVNRIEIALWLLREQDYRHFYRELHAFTNPTDTAQDLSCDLIRVTDFSENQVETKTLFRDGEVPIGAMRIAFANLRPTTDDLLPGQEFPGQIVWSDSDSD